MPSFRPIPLTLPPIAAYADKVERAFDATLTGERAKAAPQEKR